MRLSAIAEIVAPLERMSAESLHGILRGPAFASQLTALPGRGRTSPADFAPVEAARVRLLLAARDCGLAGAALGALTSELNAFPNADLQPTPKSCMSEGGGSHYARGLETIVRGTFAGEAWHLRVDFGVDHLGSRIIRAAVIHEDWTPLPHIVETPRGTLVIPASDLIAPLADLLKGA